MKSEELWRMVRESPLNRFEPSAPVSTTGQSVRYQPLTVQQLKPAWSRLMLCRYILRLRARIRELEAEMAERG